MLAEIVAEGERAIKMRGRITPAITDEWQMWLLIHGPTLLTVAKAAVEMRSLIPYGYDHIPGKTSEWDQALAAFDAAAGRR